MMLKQTAIYQVLNNARRSDLETLAWFNAFTPTIREKIKRLIVEDQHINKGIDEDGDIIGEYSRATELITNGAKQEGDPFTLEDSGAFHASIFVRILKDAIEIDGDTAKMESGDWWTIWNVNKDRILGLTDENMDKVVEDIKPRYREYLKNVLLNIR